MWHDTETGDHDNERLEQSLVKYLGKSNHEKWGKEGLPLYYTKNEVYKEKSACMHS